MDRERFLLFFHAGRDADASRPCFYPVHTVFPDIRDGQPCAGDSVPRAAGTVWVAPGAGHGGGRFPGWFRGRLRGREKFFRGQVKDSGGAERAFG